MSMPWILCEIKCNSNPKTAKQFRICATVRVSAPNVVRYKYPHHDIQISAIPIRNSAVLRASFHCCCVIWSFKVVSPEVQASILANRSQSSANAAEQSVKLHTPAHTVYRHLRNIRFIIYPRGTPMGFYFLIKSLNPRCVVPTGGIAMEALRASISLSHWERVPRSGG